jgi:5-methylcytosine-specific restriction endonuclease McrA
MVTEKWCSKCLQTKSVEDFYRDASRRDGFETHCKTCSNAIRLQGQRGYRERTKRDVWNKLREMHHNSRRARKAEAFVEEVDRKVVWERDEGKCQWCGCDVPYKEMHLDHVIPLAKGGEHSYANTQVLCASCNGRKGAKLGWNGE